QHELKQASGKAKYATWGYSSGKRHVKAKVMELPFAEDLGSLAKKMSDGLLFADEEISPLSSSSDETEDAVEKVFVRIDDYLSQEISHVLQRSYSSDYLSTGAGPRTRIKYVKIPGSRSALMLKQASGAAAAAAVSGTSNG